MSDTDLSQMSNEDLMAAYKAAKGGQPSATRQDLSNMSNEELMAAYKSAQTQPQTNQDSGALSYAGGLLKTGAEKAAGLVGSGVHSVMRSLDAYGGAPVRSAIGNLYDQGSMSSPVESLENAAGAYGKQFGQPPENAPTPTQLAGKMGFDTKTKFGPKGYEMTGADLAAPMVGMVTDPLMYEEALKTAGQGVAALGDKASEAARYVAPKLSDAVSTVYNKGKGLLSQVLGEGTGIGKTPTKIYMDRGPEIDQLGKDYGGDYVQYSNDVKDRIQAAIAQKKGEWSQQISSELSSLPKDAEGVDASSIKDPVKEIRSSLNKNLDMSVADRKTIKSDILEQIDNVTRKDGTIHPDDAFDLYNQMRQMASGQYPKNGQIFTGSDDVGRAAKAAASALKSSFSDILPETQEAFGNYSKLHDINDVINKNMLVPGRSEASLLGAGATEFNKNRSNLKELDDLLGTNFVKDAENGVAMRAFYQPGLTSYIPTGKHSAMTGLGVGTGYAIGHALGEPTAGAGIGLVAGQALSSPKAVKGLINMGRPSNVGLLPSIYQKGKAIDIGRGIMENQNK